MLCEPAMKRVLRTALKDSRTRRDQQTCWTFNMAMAAGLVFGLALLLYARFKGKLTDEEKAAKEGQRYRYIVEKLGLLTEMRGTRNKGILTGLPRWDRPVGAI